MGRASGRMDHLQRSLFHSRSSRRSSFSSSRNYCNINSSNNSNINIRSNR